MKKFLKFTLVILILAIIFLIINCYQKKITSNSSHIKNNLKNKPKQIENFISTLNAFNLVQGKIIELLSIRIRNIDSNLGDYYNIKKSDYESSYYSKLLENENNLLRKYTKNNYYNKVKNNLGRNLIRNNIDKNLLSYFLLSYEPNILFKAEIDSQLMNGRNFSIIYKIEKKDSNFSYQNNLLFKLKKSNYKKTNLPMTELYKFLENIIDGNLEYKNFNNYDICFELPTRSNFEFKTENNKNNIDSELFIFPGDYKLTLMIEAYDENEYNDFGLNFSILNRYNETVPIEITSQEDNFSLKSSKRENRFYDLESLTYYLNYLLLLVSKEEETDFSPEEGITIDINNLELLSLNRNIRLYNSNMYHSEKNANLFRLVLYFLYGELLEAINQPNQNYQKNTDLELLVDNYFNLNNVTETIASYSECAVCGSIGLSQNDLKKNYLREKHSEKRGQLLIYRGRLSNNNEFITKMNDFFTQLVGSNGNDNNINFFNNCLRNIYTLYQNKFSNEENVTIKLFTKEYEFNIGAQSRYDRLEEPAYVIDMDPKPRETLIRIQNDLKNTFANRKNPDFNTDNFLSTDTKSTLRKIQEQSINGNPIMIDKFIRLKDIILNLMEEIRSGNLRKLNHFLHMDIENQYVFPNEVYQDYIVEGFANRNNQENKLGDIYKNFKKISNRMNKIDKPKITFSEQDIQFTNALTKNIYNMYNKDMKMFTADGEMIEYFENDLSLPHKHTKYGQIKFNKDIKDIDDPEWLKDPKNMNLVSDYSFIPKENKDLIVNSISKMSQSINNTTNFMSNLFSRYKELSDEEKGTMAKVSNTTHNSLNERENLFDEDYLKKEKEQEDMMKEINKKINDIEKQQNRMEDLNKNKYKSIKSFGDGQTYSVKHHNDKYNIRANKGCLENNNNILSINDCSTNQSQQFVIKNINNKDEYNKYLKEEDKVDSFSENIFYPFSIISPNLNDKTCLSVNGANIGLVDCSNNINQRWDAIKSEKMCKGKFN
jgi:hypothetical protein